jgi:pSer/pThr/pTyr-binding forkhead associated (FHA) protein
MIRLTVIAGRQPGHSVVSGRFPLTLGRSPGSGLCLEDPGVWGTHATITLDDAGHFDVEGHPEAGVIVNGVASPRQRLRNGDVLTLGSAKVRFALSETRQRSFRFREWMTWLCILLLCLLQLALIQWWLP